MASRARGGLLRPLVTFLHTESAGAILLLVGTVAALIWANSPWHAAYEQLWATDVHLGIGDKVLSLSLHEWVNDGLMALFFLVVGLEIKRELVVGELRDPRQAALPAIAALGGMIVPALVFTAFNAGTSTASGWGIPMATDIAMALGALTLVKRRIHPSLPLFLLALAIVDDIGAIVVIAVFYSTGSSLLWLAYAAAAVGVMAVLRWRRVTLMPIYVVLGLFSWFALHEGHVHPTIAGVAFGLLTPVAPALHEVSEAELADVSTPEAARHTVHLARHAVSQVERLEHALHPWTSYLIIPLFALANAGVELSGHSISSAATSALGIGIAVGLVVGKPVGITLFAWLATRLGIARLPAGATWAGVFGTAAVAGIGFTVAIFISTLAFAQPQLDTAKIAVLGASLLSAAIGTAVLVSRGAR